MSIGMEGVVVRSCDGRSVRVALEHSARVAMLRKAASALLQCQDKEVRLVRGRSLARDDESVDQQSEYVLLELVGGSVAAVPKTGAATLEDVARATGGALPVASAPRPPVPADEVQNRIRGFMNSLFVGEPPREEEDEDEEEQQQQQQQQQQQHPDNEQNNPENENAVDEEAVRTLTAMGFSANAARKALILCGHQTEQAMDWILEHAGDATLDEPLTAAELAAARRQRRPRARRPAFVPDQAVAARLVDMGFPPEQVAEALRATRNDENAAVAFLLGEGPRGPAGGDGEGGGDEEDDEDGINIANPMLRALLTHPGIQEGLRNPRVLDAFRQIMADPAAARDLLADPEVGPVLLQVNRILQMGGIADDQADN